MDYPRLTDPKLATSDYVKIPAGRLLDELGWRGKKIGNVGTFSQHALVIVTYPGATGPEVYEFTENMRLDVKKNFDINLEYEVVIV
jgi:UDP-N-acetylmuramate dehydrogenase